MSKRAFTLIELLAIIVILGILTTIVVPSVFSLIQKTKESSYHVLINLIENGAELYVSRHRSDIVDLIELNGSYEMTLQQLIDDGLLKQPLTDPRTNEPIPLTKRIAVTKNERNQLNVCYEERNCEI